MAQSTTNDLGVVSRVLPQPIGDGIEQIKRLSRYREQIVQPLSKQAVCDEGSYFTACNPTPGTAIAFAVNAAVSETAGYYFLLKNNDVVSSPTAKRIYLDYLRLICGTAPASATSGHFFLGLDYVNRYTSGGSQLAPANANGDMASPSMAIVYAGALTTPANGSSRRILARGVLRSAIAVVNDEWVLKCGTDEAAHPGTLGGTVALRMPVPLPPIVIGPQQTLGLQLWFPANAVTAAQFEVEAGWWER